jgi:hypothetical protein
MFTGDFSSEGNKTPLEIFNNHKDEYGSFDVVMSPVDDRVTKWMALSDAFSYEVEEPTLYDAQGEPIIRFLRRPKIFIMEHCIHTWSSATLATHNENKAEDVKKTKGYYGPGEGDDELEALANIWATASASVPLARQKTAAAKELKAYINRAKARINDTNGERPRIRNIAKFN